MGLSHSINDDEIVKLFRRGYPIAEIARTLGTTYETVKYRLIRNGLLVYRDGRYFPVRSQRTEEIRVELMSLNKDLKAYPDSTATLRKIEKISLVLGEHNPIGYDIHRRAKALMNGEGTQKALNRAIDRLEGEESK